MKGEEHHVIGAVVIVSILLAATLGAMLIFEQPVGKAFQMPGLDELQECSCKKAGSQFSVLYSDSGYVLLPDGQYRNVGIFDEDVCPNVCASIGAYY